MPEAILEIVELETGEVVLRRSDSSEGSSEPFVSIKFSEEAKVLVNHQSANLARFMISVGLQMVAKIHAEALQEAGVEQTATDDTDESPVPPNSRLH
ncbi:hypothetical protein [Agitococcus lubricus]|uniref:Uncharacterized protein n=1 Tax=Agitococcus lubricus TaxID=1077255 RepID=A0A2T5J1X6_9GAMM|nr:hypothetical protein [Agitococcus lubricus]PTQ90437.1 hypothetical protein C8N29_103190 [Agitococcus lubricus]